MPEITGECRPDRPGPVDRAPAWTRKGPGAARAENGAGGTGPLHDARTAIRRPRCSDRGAQTAMLRPRCSDRDARTQPAAGADAVEPVDAAAGVEDDEPVDEPDDEFDELTELLEEDRLSVR
ncbi:hypothetical protein BX265_2931 [Streptomyces sp. TLI_235]|nr:hypothetical protein BX265_2931 [Streptomyces sp. TLI_235]